MTAGLPRWIDANPECILEIDWREETNWFTKKGIQDILMGIERDEVFECVGEIITEAWYETCETEDEDDRLTDYPDDTYFNFRFNCRRDWPNEMGRIEFYINDIKIKRERRRQIHAKVKKLEPRSTIEVIAARPLPAPVTEIMDRIWDDTLPDPADNEDSQEQTEATTKKGRKTDILFKADKLAQMRNEFIYGLADNNIALPQGDEKYNKAERDNLYKALISFVNEHEQAKDNPSPASYIRFLTETCNLLPPNENGKNNTNYENYIRKILNNK